MDSACVVKQVRFDRLTMTELLSLITERISQEKDTDKDIMTLSLANPEIVLEAQKNSELLQYLQHTDYCVADGVGVLWYAKAMGCPLPERITGTDFVHRLFEVSQKEGFSLFLLGGEPGIAEKAADRLMNIYPGANIAGMHHGYFDDQDIDEVIKQINDSQADCVMVCLGFPKQELFIQRHRTKFSASLLFGNGGALDFWSGKRKRAPEFLINMHLEWLYRLFQDLNFKRIKRQFKLVKFVWYILVAYVKKRDV